MKIISCALALFILSSTAFSQKKWYRDFYNDSTSNTVIESLLKQTGIIKKVEFIEVERVKVLRFEIIVVVNVRTGEKVKGLYLSNQSGINNVFGVSERHAYLDENEVRDLIDFFSLCNSEWKDVTPVSDTQYEFESLDRLNLIFSTKKNTNSWGYTIRFGNYRFENSETMDKSRSEELLSALKLVEEELKKY